MSKYNNEMFSYIEDVNFRNRHEKYFKILEHRVKCMSENERMEKLSAELTDLNFQIWQRKFWRIAVYILKLIALASIPVLGYGFLSKSLSIESKFIDVLFVAYVIHIKKAKQKGMGGKEEAYWIERNALMAIMHAYKVNYKTSVKSMFKYYTQKQ